MRNDPKLRHFINHNWQMAWLQRKEERSFKKQHRSHLEEQMEKELSFKQSSLYANLEEMKQAQE